MEIDINTYRRELSQYFPGVPEKELDKVIGTSINLIRQYCRKGEVALKLSSTNTLVKDGKKGTIIFTRIYGSKAVNNLKKIKRIRDERNKQCK